MRASATKCSLMRMRACLRLSAALRAGAYPIMCPPSIDMWRGLRSIAAGKAADAQEDT